MASMEMMRRYVDHLTAGEFEAAAEYWADDIVGHVSGDNATSGTYTGKEGGAAYAAKIAGRYDSIQIEEHDLLVSDQHAVLIAVSHSERNGQKHSSNSVVVYHTEGDKITEFWAIPVDQKAMDDFLS